ncbi:MAG TPA: hypothetical protein VEH52_14045 [Gaiellaceae bacterium]|nr:hypothetical protein [Gaiellaceae bacterium]
MRVVFLSVAVLVLVGCSSAERASGKERTPRVTAVEAPLPSSATGRYKLALTDVACAAPRNCAAAGYLNSNIVSRGLLFVEKGGAWSVSEPPLPETLRRGNKSESVSSVACPAVGHCVAVGVAASGPQLEPLVFTQRTHGWQETVSPLPARAKGGDLDFVSCPSVGDCTAAGTYIDSSGHDQGLLLDESNGDWAPSTSGLPPNGSVTTSGQTPAIQGLTCWAAGSCAAVGIYGDTHGSPQAWLLTETHGVWAQGVEAELPPNASTREGSYLYPVIDVGAVSCAPNGNCTAVGGYGDRRSHQFGMILSEHAGRWGPAKKTPLPANAGPNPQQGNAPRSPMSSIACPSAGRCSAVGWYLDNHANYHGLLLRERDGAWSPSELVFPSGAHAAPGVSFPGVSLDSLACASPGNCFGVGAYNPSPNRLRPLLVSEQNGRWIQGSEAPPPKSVGKNYKGGLSSVSCPSAETCVAVGYTETAGFLNERGLIVTIGRG